MNDYIDMMVGIAGIIMILSFALMGLQLIRQKVYTTFELRKNIFWPSIAFAYRDHTRKNIGKVGGIYYVFCISSVITTIMFMFQAMNIAYSASIPIFITTIIFACVIFPIIAYWVYTMWKEKYF